MAYSFRYKTPIYAGTLIKERVRCGHKNCYCSKRQRFHEAWYLYYRDYQRPDKKLRKKYIRKDSFAFYQMMLPLARYVDKYNELTLQRKLILMEKASGEEHDYANDWRTWILQSDMSMDDKLKVMRDEPLIDYTKGPYKWQCLVRTL